MDTENLSPNDLRQQRIENMHKLEEAGYAAFGRAFERDGRFSELTEAFEDGKKVSLAGRMMTCREMGKSVFAHLQDSTGRLQVYLKKNDIGEDAFNAFKYTDLGDHIGITGTWFTTRTGEKTVKVEEWTLLSKSLLPLPDKWDGLQDVETRYRQRYLDLISNPEVRKVFDARIAILREIRSFLGAQKFDEVETPMMQSIPGGAAATPFQTRYNALSMDMFLRIAPELYLKRLLVGGFDRVYELNRNFRNEGLSRNHNPEFTMLEIYEAYGNRESMQTLIHDMIVHLADTVIGSRQVGTESEPVNLDNWRAVDYDDLIKERAGDDYFELDTAGKLERAISLGCKVDSGWAEGEVTQEIFEKCIEKTLIDPTFVMRLPAELVPLAKPCADDASKVDVFELIIGGKEIAPGYNELNDPLLQRQRLEDQAGEDAMKMDNDFLIALEHGMPPAGGMGVGIDRLVMMLTGSEAIRDVILFPQMKKRAH
ncbi:lysine--tRNA ligase [Kiritimatiellota bacterium B12222]|nr:lysine--tRNA ligase [Kiritimatiellota bacterium B12222]